MTKKENLTPIERYESGKMSLQPNYILIPVTIVEMNDEGMREFNEVYQYIIHKENIHKITRTKSGGISKINITRRLPQYDVKTKGSCIELTYIGCEGLIRLQFRHNATKDLDDNGQGIFGRQAFFKFKELCKKEGINLEDYEINNGPEVKETIEKPYIQLGNRAFAGLTFEGCHHIDFHNSYPAGLCNTHPEFRPVIEPLYEQRKNNPINKAILNLTIGFMQSTLYKNACLAHLSKDAIKDNNDRIRELSSRLKTNGRIILAYNTDGIWYKGDVYHGDGEGHNVGQWENDHVDCTIRFKSAGSYEFIEDGKYTPVVRGSTNLDKTKPRTEWQWGDIYQADVIKYRFNDRIGIVAVKGEN